MIAKFRTHLVQILIILVILFLFLANVSGLLEFNIKSGPYVSIRSLGSMTDNNYFLSLAGSADFLVLLMTGLLLAVLLPVLPPFKASGLALLCIIPPFLINLADATRKPLIPLEYSLLTILILFSINVLIGYFRETHSRQKIIEIFGQFVPPDVVAEINRNPGRVSMEGDSRRLTVFFCDLQNFTGTAEQLNPRQLAALLNEYLSAMSEILFRHGATIDKYIGDSIMAFWGAPLPQTDHAARAVMSSFSMHSRIQQLSEQFIKKGWPGPKMGIGINTGMMSVGNMGSRYRVAYTVVGDAVNLASRLEGLTRIYSAPTIVSEATMQECPDILFRELDSVFVKGKHKSIRVFQPMCLQSEVNNTLHRQMGDHNQAIAHYYRNDLAEARSIFKQLAMERKDDAYYPLMLNKVEELLKT